MNKNSRNFIINQHNNAIVNISKLEKTCADCKVIDDKSKVQFGNFCIALKGYRMIADATEAILMNEDILKGEDGYFYEKIEDTTIVPEKSCNCSNFNKDNKENHE